MSENRWVRLPSDLDVLRVRDFRLVFSAALASLIGDGVVPVALAFAVLDLTGSATDLGIVLAARTIALVASLLVGGVAADRVGVETMGINADWMGYLKFCSDFGIGEFDLSRIDIRGEKIETVRRKYQLHADIERQLEWMGPIQDLPKKIG